jgi:hypothetical protein
MTPGAPDQGGPARQRHDGGLQGDRHALDRLKEIAAGADPAMVERMMAHVDAQAAMLGFGADPDSGAVGAPYVLDVSVLATVACADAGVSTADATVTGLVFGYERRGQPLIVPVLAMAAASALVRAGSQDARSGGDALRGLEQLENVTVAALRNANQAMAVAAVIYRTGFDAWDAQVAAVAAGAACPILTSLDAGKWRRHAADLDEPLHVIEITSA